MSNRDSATRSREHFPPLRPPPFIDLSPVHTYSHLLSRLQPYLFELGPELSYDVKYELADACNRIDAANKTLEDLREPLEARIEKLYANMDERRGRDAESGDESLILWILDKVTDVEEDGVEGWRRLLESLVGPRKARKNVEQCDFEVFEVSASQESSGEEQHQLELEHEIEDEILRPAFGEETVSGQGAGMKQPDSRQVKSEKGKEKAAQVPQGMYQRLEQDRSPHSQARASSHFANPRQQSGTFQAPDPSSNDRKSSYRSTAAQKGSDKSENFQGKKTYYEKARNPITYESQGLAGPPPVRTWEEVIAEQTCTALRNSPALSFSTGKKYKVQEDVEALRKHVAHIREQAEKYREAGPGARTTARVGRVPPYMYVPLMPGFTITREDGLECDFVFPTRSHLFFIPGCATREEFYHLVATPHATTWRDHEWTRTYLKEASIIRHDCKDPDFEKIEQALRTALVRQCRPVSTALHSHQEIAIFEHLWEGTGQGTYFLVSNPDVLVDGTPLIVWWNKDFRDWSAKDKTDYANWRSQRKAALRGGAGHSSELRGLSQEEYDASSEMADDTTPDDPSPSEPRSRVGLTNDNRVPGYLFMPLPAGFRLPYPSSDQTFTKFPTAAGAFHVPGGIEVEDFSNRILDTPHTNMWRCIYGFDDTADQMIHVISSQEMKRRLQGAIRAQTPNAGLACYGHENDEVALTFGTWAVEHSDRPDTFIVSRHDAIYPSQNQPETRRSRNFSNGYGGPRPETERSIRLDGASEPQPSLRGGGIMDWNLWYRYIDELRKSRRTKHIPGTNSERLPILRCGTNSADDGDTHVHLRSDATVTAPYVQVVIPAGLRVPCREDPSRNLVFPSRGSLFHFPRGAAKQQVLNFLVRQSSVPRDFEHVNPHYHLTHVKNPKFLRSLRDALFVHGPEVPVHKYGYFGDWTLDIGDTYILTEKAFEPHDRYHKTPSSSQHVEESENAGGASVADDADEIGSTIEIPAAALEAIAVAQLGEDMPDVPHNPQMRGGAGSPGREVRFIRTAERTMGGHTPDKFTWVDVPETSFTNVSPQMLQKRLWKLQQKLPKTEGMLKHVSSWVGYWEQQAHDADVGKNAACNKQIAVENKARELENQLNHAENTLVDLEEDYRQLRFKYEDLEDQYEKLEEEYENLVVPATKTEELVQTQETIANFQKQIDDLESQLPVTRHQCTGGPKGPKTPSLRGGAGNPFHLQVPVTQQDDKEDNSADNDLKRIPSDWKEWKGLPNPGHIPKFEKTNTSLGSQSHQEPSTEDISATGFYFFPSVSTVALLSDPLHFFQWPVPLTLTQIRDFLQGRKKRNVEDRSEFVRIREVLEIRDEMGLHDPDTSSGRMVLVNIPEPEIPDLPPSRPISQEGSVSGRHELEPVRSQLDLRADLDALNYRRSERGLPRVEFELGDNSDSEQEDRYRNIDGIINLMNNDITSSEEYGPPGSTCSCSVCRPGYNMGLDGTSELDRPTAWGSHPSQMASRSRRNERDIPLFDSPTLPHYPTNRDGHRYVCRSWAGHIDSHDNRCSYCDLYMTEIEPHRELPTTSRTHPINHEDRAPSPSAYSQPLTSSSLSFHDEAADRRIGASYPFKVCTNPYACPPVTDTQSHVRYAPTHTPPPTRLVTPLPSNPSTPPSTPPSSEDAHNRSASRIDTFRNVEDQLDDIWDSFAEIAWGMLDDPDLRAADDADPDYPLGVEAQRYILMYEGVINLFDELCDKVHDMIGEEQRRRLTQRRRRSARNKMELPGGQGRGPNLNQGVGNAGPRAPAPGTPSELLGRQRAPVPAPSEGAGLHSAGPRLTYVTRFVNQRREPNAEAGPSRPRVVPQSRSDSEELDEYEAFLRQEQRRLGGGRRGSRGRGYGDWMG